MSNYSILRCVSVVKGKTRTLNLETGVWNPEPETRIQNSDVMDDDRNNSLKQCLITKSGKKLFCCYFLGLIPQPQTVIAEKLLTSSKQPLATHLVWLLKRWIKLSIIE